MKIIELTVTHAINYAGDCLRCPAGFKYGQITFCSPFNELMERNKWNEIVQCDGCKEYLKELSKKYCNVCHQYIKSDGSCGCPFDQNCGIQKYLEE